MDIHQIKFGNTLWGKALLPSVTHVEGAWFKESNSAKMLYPHPIQMCQSSTKIIQHALKNCNCRRTWMASYNYG